MHHNLPKSVSPRRQASWMTRCGVALCASFGLQAVYATPVAVTTLGLAQASGAGQEQRAKQLYESLAAFDGTALGATTKRQHDILDWLHEFTEPRGLVVSRETLPYVTLGAIRHVYIRADVQWQGGGLLDALLANPNEYYWHTCSYLVEMFTHVMDEFEVPTRPLQHFRMVDFTHATCEFYSEQAEDWVFVDLLYGSVFVDATAHAASFATLVDEMTSHGVSVPAQPSWAHNFLRFYSVFDTQPVPSPVPLVEQLDKRNYAVVVDYYFPVTAIRYDDVLYHSASSRPINAPISAQHRGRWLVIDASLDPELSLARYDGTFWTWFHDRYHLRSGGNYTYDVLQLSDGLAGVLRFDPTSRLVRHAEVTPSGLGMSIHDAVPLPHTRLFRWLR